MRRIKAHVYLQLRLGKSSWVREKEIRFCICTTLQPTLEPSVLTRKPQDYLTILWATNAKRSLFLPYANPMRCRSSPHHPCLPPMLLPVCSSIQTPALRRRQRSRAPHHSMKYDVGRAVDGNLEVPRNTAKSVLINSSQDSAPDHRRGISTCGP